MSKRLFRPIILIPAIFVIVIVVIAIGRQRNAKPAYQTITVSRGDVKQEVSVTGTVEPVENVELSLERSGRVAAVSAKVGDKVSTGGVLLRLDNLGLSADVAEAQANAANSRAQLKQYQSALDSAEAKLDELRSGTRPEEIAVVQSELDRAQAAVVEAKQNVIDKLQDAYTKADDAVHSKADQFIINANTTNPQVSFPVSNSVAEAGFESNRSSVGAVLISWQAQLLSVPATNDMAPYLAAGDSNLLQVSAFLDLGLQVLNAAVISPSFSQSTVDGYKTDIASGRTNVSAARINVSAAREKLALAEADVVVAQNKLALAEAGTVTEQVTSQEAAVKQAEANVEGQAARVQQADAQVLSAQAELAKTILRSPISGIVTMQEAKVGEYVTSGKALAAVISEAAFQITTKVPEADIAKIVVGQDAVSTLDAYGSDTEFQVRVAAIDPAETIVDGVATYKVTILFVENDSRVRSGMTANIDVATGLRRDVVVLPLRAVINKDGKKIVRKKIGETIEETEVTLGLRGSDGNVEIITGIEVGDTVVVD